MSSQRVLVVDDEPSMRRVLEIMLSRMGYRTAAAADGLEALQCLADQDFDLMISDLRMPGLNGIALLEKMRESELDVPVIIITAHGSIESAVEAMRLGACDYLLRPFDMEALELAIRRVFAQRNVLRQNDYLREQIEAPWSGLVGDSAAMKSVHKMIEQVGPTRATVLITGETGTGKELVARAIHRASDRRDALFVPINCAAIPADMLESELFGHEKGAFTGAIKARTGKFELSSGGTLFLDEVTEMPMALQAKLLRVLQEGVVERIGSNDTLELDLRIIAATNRTPQAAVSEGRLREDLYYRLNVFQLPLPALRERREDIATLARHFAASQHPPGRLTDTALAQLAAYDWPGNVRELQNMVERAHVLCGGKAMDPSHFPLQSASTTALPAVTDTAVPAEAADFDEAGLDHAVEQLERRLISEALRRTGDNKARAALMLRISERSIWYKLKKYWPEGAADQA